MARACHLLVLVAALLARTGCGVAIVPRADGQGLDLSVEGGDVAMTIDDQGMPVQDEVPAAGQGKRVMRSERASQAPTVRAAVMPPATGPADIPGRGFIGGGFPTGPTPGGGGFPTGPTPGGPPPKPSTPETQVTPFKVMPCPGAVMTTPSLTKCDYQKMVDAVQDKFNQLPKTCAKDTCPQADWAGCVLRMAGHDFMDFEPRGNADGTDFGGSDGCTNLEASDNAGLRPCLVDGEFGISINGIYQQFCKQVSLADFLIIAAEAVMMSTRALAKGSPMDFRSRFLFGRTTKETCVGAGRHLPDPELGCSENERVFVKNLGLDWKGTAALMGVHSLGRAVAANSGYSGWWKDAATARHFDNGYYRTMLLDGWAPQTAVNGNRGKNQWKRGDLGKMPPGDGATMMLNTDMCLAFSNIGIRDLLAANASCCTWLTPSAMPRVVGPFCGGGNAPPRGGIHVEGAQCCGNVGPCDGVPFGGAGMAFEHVLAFAQDDGAWATAFLDAWSAVTKKGFKSLSPLGSCSGIKEVTTTTTTRAPAATTTTRTPAPTTRASGGWGVPTTTTVRAGWGAPAATTQRPTTTTPRPTTTTTTPRPTTPRPTQRAVGYAAPTTTTRKPTTTTPRPTTTTPKPTTTTPRPTTTTPRPTTTTPRPTTTTPRPTQRAAGYAAPTTTTRPPTTTVRRTGYR